MRTLHLLAIARGAALPALLLAAAGAAGACARPSRVREGPVATPTTAAPPAAPQPDTAATPPARESSAAPTAAAAGRGSLLVNEEEYQGWRYYHVYCARCHGQDALGSLDAADLRYSVTEEGGVSPDSFLVMVRNGSDDKEMPPFHEVLEDARIRQVYAYVRARSEGRLVAGRPRRSASPP